MDDTSIYFGTESNKETTCTEKERKNSEKQQQITIANTFTKKKRKNSEKQQQITIANTCTKKKRKNSEKQQQITIAKYWNIKNNDIKQNVLIELVSEFQAESKNSQEIKTSIIDTGNVEAEGTQISGTLNNYGDILRKRSRELSWTQRASIIYFYLHPFMGRIDMKFTSKLFSINSRTLEGWLTKKEMISKWLTIVRNLDGRSVRKCIPQKFIHKYKESVNRYDSLHIDLRPFEKKCMKRNTQTKFCVVRSGYSSRLDIVRAKKKRTWLFVDG